MSFNYDLATKSMIEAINMYAGAKTQQKQIENQLLQQEIDRKRKEEDWQKRQEYMSPIEQAFARRYMRENPGEIGDYAEMPGALGAIAKKTKSGMIQEGTGGQATTSQGVNVPSRYTPPSPAQKTTKMTGSGFAPMTTKEQIIENAMQKYLRGEATDKEKKMLGIDKEEEFRSDLENVSKGTMAIDKLKKKYPLKAQDIKSYQIEQMNPMTQAIMGQIEDQLGAFKAKGGESLVEGYTEHMEKVINQLLDDKAIAESKGIDVDAILDVMDIKPGEWKSAGKEKKIKYLKPLLRFFLGGN